MKKLVRYDPETAKIVPCANCGSLVVLNKDGDPSKWIISCGCYPSAPIPQYCVVDAVSRKNLLKHYKLIEITEKEA